MPPQHTTGQTVAMTTPAQPTGPQPDAAQPPGPQPTAAQPRAALTQPRRGPGVLGLLRAHLHGTDDTHHVTNLELLFDLVFVYCITSVTALMEHHVGGRSVLEGLITLSVVWFGWCSYAWLGNQAKADEGLLRVAMIIAMAGMFFVAVSIPYAFDEHGNAALVLVAAYSVVRLVHIAVYLIAAGNDPNMRSVLTGMLGVILAMLALLWIGALVGGHAQVWWWLAAVVVDQAGVYFVRSSRWVLNSASHFSERFGLVVLIAVGESIVDLGAAGTRADLSVRLAFALLGGFTVAVSLWWLYFDVVSIVAGRVLRESHGQRRTTLARESYTYIHLLFVGGIVFAAMGLYLLASEEHVDAGRYALDGGIALYLFGHLLFRLRNLGSVNRGRMVAMVIALALIPLTAWFDPLGQLLLPAILVGGLVGWEVWAFRTWRDEVRHSETIEA
jgi:low temperature requirement protein LtrA